MLEKLKSDAWLSFATVLMFVGATFQIADERWILATVCFGVATGLMVLAKHRRKSGQDDDSLEV